MTFGLGIRVEEGLLAIADTRITSGMEVTRERKIAVYQHDGRTFFVLTSGLRSVRDKTLTYFAASLESRTAPFSHLFQVVNDFAAQIRCVAAEDAAALAHSGLSFDMYCLIGGQLRADTTPHLYLLYPEANWVEIGEGTPYQIIGVGGYGKPILDRALVYSDSLRHALRVGLLSFDSTRISAASVDLPVDVVLFTANPYRVVTHRYTHADLAALSTYWQDHLRAGVQGLPTDWEDPIFAKLQEPGG